MLTVTSIIFDSRIQKEARALRDAGYEVTILSVEDQELMRGVADASATWQAYLASTPGITTRRFFLRARTWKWLPKPVNKALQAVELFFKFGRAVLRNGADIIHCHDLTPALFAWIGKWRYGAMIIYDAHELEVDQQASGGIKARLLAIYERQMIRRSSHVITVNAMIRDIMQDRYGMPVHVIENRPEYLPADRLDTQKLRRELQVPDDRRIVLYVGNLSLTRGIDKMVEALKYLDHSIHFYIMGTGRIQEYKAQVEDLLRTHRIDQERVRFIGPYPPGDVIQYLSGADVSVLLYQPTSNNMLFNAPNKLFQSIVARVPMVASHNKTFPGLIRPNTDEAIGVTVDATDPVAIAAGLEALLDEDYYRQARVNLQQRAKEVSWASEQEKLIRIYGGLSDHPRDTMILKSQERA